jgi:hypothetical protein
VAVLGNAPHVGVREQYHHRFATVRATGAVDGPKNLQMQLPGHLVGTESIVSEFETAEKLIVLLGPSFCALLPITHDSVVVH